MVALKALAGGIDGDLHGEEVGGVAVCEELGEEGAGVCSSSSGEHGDGFGDDSRDVEFHGRSAVLDGPRVEVEGTGSLG